MSLPSEQHLRATEQQWGRRPGSDPVPARAGRPEWSADHRSQPAAAPVNAPGHTAPASADEPDGPASSGRDTDCSADYWTQRRDTANTNSSQRAAAFSYQESDDRGNQSADRHPNCSHPGPDWESDSAPAAGLHPAGVTHIVYLIFYCKYRIVRHYLNILLLGSSQG